MSTCCLMAVCLPLLLGILWLGVRVQGQLVKKGSCPKVNATKGVTLHELSREWFQFRVIQNPLNADTSCNLLCLHLLDFPPSFVQGAVKKGQSKLSFINGEINVPDYDNPGKFILQFEVKRKLEELNVTVVQLTKDVLVLYRCVDLPCLPDFYAVFLSIYSSKRGEVPAAELKAANDVINKLGVNATRDLVAVKNDPCPRHFFHEDPWSHFSFFFDF